MKSVRNHGNEVVFVLMISLIVTGCDIKLVYVSEKKNLKMKKE